MSRLEEVLEVATGKELDASDLAELTQLAINSNSVQKVVETLLCSGPKALLNLRHASDLRQAHAGVMRTSRSRVGPRVDQKVVTGPIKCGYSAHAIERFIGRFMEQGTHIERDKAEELFQEELNQATRMKTRTSRGDEQWLTPCGAVVVVKRDGKGRPGIVATVLFDFSHE